ncbi:MAG: twin-arginine translocase subunit TatB [Betaproteobacteria bacterium]|nr:twin-arginine translocase subunit TatB [Betaproteobacteria bacterium]
MFDVGFSELVVIALVALIVIGPERLPKVARTIGILLGRLQRYVNDVKSDINREIQLDELKKLQEQVASETREFETSLHQEMHSVESTLNQSIAPPDNAPVADDPASPAALPSLEDVMSAAATTEPVPSDPLASGNATKVESAQASHV